MSDRGGGRGQRHRERVKAEQSAESGDPADKVIGDRDWLERVAYNIVRHELVHCPSVHDAVHILSLLAEENIALVFSFDGNDNIINDNCVLLLLLLRSPAISLGFTTLG